ncbi:MAG: acetyl-CoA carboxylase biotin carboxyl carrier protein subunit [Saprospiraceae bacterium]|nr:acetyl-CoA carboxylase biotin carboxyl carrier protein subunit [Saprospiraceae bacterium]MCB9328006.1 acetyl-CoA carboxylase biotin carboxyl carrier protein subunit [Lewinellaceae bacterium]
MIQKVEFEQFDALTPQSDLPFNITSLGQGEYIINKNGKNHQLKVVSFDPYTKKFEFIVNNVRISGIAKTELDLLIESMGFLKDFRDNTKEIIAPMPGLVVDVLVSVGDEKQKSDNIVILEAMKMENILKSEGDGKVSEILIKKGDSVSKGQVLIRFE